MKKIKHSTAQLSLFDRSMHCNNIRTMCQKANKKATEVIIKFSIHESLTGNETAIKRIYTC